MTDVFETRYVRSADGTTVAYQIGGSGLVDLVMELDLAIPIDLLGDDPGALSLRKRLATIGRTVWHERRGKGASGGDPGANLDDELLDDDLTAVLDAIDLERVALFGSGDAGPAVIHFAARHPERVSALVLLNAYAHYIREDDYPVGLPAEAVDRFAVVTKEGWGTGRGLEVIGPSRAADESFRRWWARCERLGMSPDSFTSGLQAGYRRDVRPLLGSLRVPTLVLHHEGDRYIQLRAGRYLAEHIPGAKLVVLRGDDHMFFLGDVDRLVDEIEEFLTGRHQAPEGDVVMATVLFTDIVNSTAQAAARGHRAWTTLTDQHDHVVRSALQLHRGREVKTTGDGFLAVFDGASRALRCATEIVELAAQLGVEVRAGVHAGEVEVRDDDDIAGLAVAVGKRICDLAGPREVLVSSALPPMVAGSGIEFEDRGEHELKGVPGAWRLFSVEG